MLAAPGPLRLNYIANKLLLLEYGASIEEYYVRGIHLVDLKR